MCWDVFHLIFMKLGYMYYECIKRICMLGIVYNNVLYELWFYLVLISIVHFEDVVSFSNANKLTTCTHSKIWLLQTILIWRKEEFGIDKRFYWHSISLVDRWSVQMNSRWSNLLWPVTKAPEDITFFRRYN